MAGEASGLAAGPASAKLRPQMAIPGAQAQGVPIVLQLQKPADSPADKAQAWSPIVVSVAALLITL